MIDLPVDTEAGQITTTDTEVLNSAEEVASTVHHETVLRGRCGTTQEFHRRLGAFQFDSEPAST
jgi:hypothetical protein